MKPWIKAWLVGFGGALVGCAVAWLAYTAYTDHRAIWEVVAHLNAQIKASQPAPQASAPTQAK